MYKLPAHISKTESEDWTNTICVFQGKTKCWFEGRVS